MDTNTNANANNNNTGSNPFNMKPLGRALDTPVEEWASSTLSALGPTSGTTTSNATTTTNATNASAPPPAYPSKITTHPTMPATHTIGSTSAAETEAATPAYSHKFPSPKPSDTISAFSDSVPPPIPRKNNPFLDDQTPTFDAELTTASTSTSSAGEHDPGVHFASIANAAPAAHNPAEAASASTATTPGLNIPGAYPGMEKEHMTDGDLAMARAATAVALERAKELALATGETMMDVVDTVLPAVKAYIPSAQTTKDAAVNAGQAVGNTAANAGSNISEARPVDTTKSYLASAGDVIRNYVPAAVSAYLPGTTQPTATLPSQETGQNVHPASSDGVGTLPGPPGEIGVAVLPDERTGGNLKDTHTHPTHLGGVGTLPGDAAESGVAVLPEERNRAMMLPSAQAGLGLPGATDEAGVAVLPIERGAGNEHVLMEKDAHRVLVGAVPGAEHYDAVDGDAGATKSSGHAGNGSVAFVEPPFEPTANVYTNSPPPPPPPPSSAPDSLLSPTPISNAASTLNGASADASIRSLAGSKNDQFEQSSNANPITTTTNSVPHPEPNAIPNPTAVPAPAPALTAAAAPVTLAGGVVSPAATKDHAASGVDGRHKLNREELAHHQDSTTATQGHGSPLTAADSANPNSLSTTDSPGNGGASHGKSASTSSSSSTGKKPSLFSKMKGEMKVLSGRIGHNEEKIEEGRRMMGKTLN